jgi:hypothetical protein
MNIQPSIRVKTVVDMEEQAVKACHGTLKQLMGRAMSRTASGFVFCQYD